MRVIPFGDRILVKRRKIGDKLGSGLLVAADTTAERLTDLADVTDVPELTQEDSEILDNAKDIIRSLVDKAKYGDSEALKAAMNLAAFCKLKSIRVGDSVFVSKYIGTDFHDTQDPQITKTLLKTDDIIGLVIDDE
jgi:co-chaperonin GroES (HSP10)